MNNPTVLQLVENEWNHLQKEIETIRMVIESVTGTLGEYQQKLSELEERNGNLKRYLVEYDSQTH
jgi:chromosome segregation ATPase